MKQRRRLINHANAKSKSEKFPPPHQDGGLGYPPGLGSSLHMNPNIDPPDIPFSSMNFSYAKDPMQTWSGPLVDHGGGVGAPRKKSKKDSRRDKSSSRNKEKDDI